MTQNGLTSQLGNVPGLMSVTASYVPVPPTLVYLSALSAPDADDGGATRFAGRGCAETKGRMRVRERMREGRVT